MNIVDLYKFHYSFSLFMLFYLVPFFVGAVFFFYYSGKDVRQLNDKKVSFLNVIFKTIGIFCALLGIVFVAFSIQDYKTAKEIYLTGKGEKTIEGYVTDFYPESSARKTREHFCINNTEFTYANEDTSAGYHTSKEKGGVISGNGQHLIIKYYENDGEKIILYIGEIK